MNKVTKSVDERITDKMEKALKLIEKAGQELISARCLAIRKRDFPMAGSMTHFMDQLNAIEESDEGECGIRPLLVSRLKEEGR